MSEFGYSYTNPTASDNELDGGGDVPANALLLSGGEPLLLSGGEYLLLADA